MKIIMFIYDLLKREKPFAVLLIALTLLALCAPTSKAIAQKRAQKNVKHASYVETTKATSTTAATRSTTTIATIDTTSTTNTIVSSKTTSITTTTTTTATETVTPSFSCSDEEYIMLCNCVGYEAGADYIATEEKAKVVEVILNRVMDENYPNTIYDVLTQPNQFSGVYTYIDLGEFSSKVSEDVKKSVTLYLDGEYENHGYFSFWGDGRNNHFS